MLPVVALFPDLIEPESHSVGLMEGEPEVDHIKLQTSRESTPWWAEIQPISTVVTFIFIAGKLPNNSLFFCCFVFNQNTRNKDYNRRY